MFIYIEKALMTEKGEIGLTYPKNSFLPLFLLLFKQCKRHKTVVDEVVVTRKLTLPVRPEYHPECICQVFGIKWFYEVQVRSIVIALFNILHINGAAVNNDA